DASNIVELTIETRGSFVQNGDGINSGNFTLGSGARARVIKQTALLDNWYEYTYWSSPVIGETVESAFPDTPSNRRFRFDAQNFSDDCAEIANSNTCNPGVKDDIDDAAPYDWVNIPNGLMETGRGYAATYSLFAPYPNLIGSATFEAGAFNTGDIDVAIYRDNTVTDDNNWNLIGNPYPSAISAQQFLTENTALIEGNPGGSIQGAIFLWSHDTAPDGDTSGNEVLNFSQSDYAVINGAAGTAGGDGLSPNPYIPSGQGFFIAYDQSAGVASDTQNTVSFKNSMREIGNNTQFFEANENIQFFDSQETNEILTDKNTLWINLTSDNGVFNQIAVAYLEGATDHYDGWYYDAPKNLSTGAYSLLYSIIPGDYQKFAVQGKSLDALNQSEIIPLGFESSIEVATIYKLSLPDYNGNFLENNDIYLKDNYSDIIYNLKDSDYNFTSEPGIFNDRFEIVFTNETLGLDDTEVRNGLIVYEDTNGVFNIKVSDANRISAIEVTDLLGRYVYRIDGLETVHHQFDGLKLSQATYLIRVSLENGVVLTKKVVKRF
ncbi:MAG: T9SS type A sorting domain-containing protein, partial [Bacteroidia bacterium]|nr:T9SS type A sorting domain-containing protein [Bacteroidia bacterium]